MTMEDVIRNYNNNGKIKDVSVSFEKVIQLEQYKTERLRAETRVELTGAEHPLLELAKAQSIVEFSVMTNLLSKGHITQLEFNGRKAELETAVTAIEAKINSLNI